MKCLCILVLCMVAVFAHEDLSGSFTATNENMSECLTESKIDKDWVDNKDLNIYITENQKDCYLTCMLKKAKLVNENGEFKTELPAGKPASDKVIAALRKWKKTIEHCKAEVGNGPCKVPACVFNHYSKNHAHFEE